MTIKEAREKKGMTQVELSAATGVSLGTIQRIENGMIDRAKVISVLKLCQAVDCDIASLFSTK